MTLRSGVHDFVAVLGTAAPGTLVLQAAVYPRAAETGLLHEQGETVARLVEGVSERVPSVSTYRILWAQVVFVASAETAEEMKKALLQVAGTASSDEVEVRGAWCTLDGPRPKYWIDEFFGELSVRRNFGSVEWVEGRMVDGRELPVDGLGPVSAITKMEG
jgi:hypothetical protein